MGGRYRMTLRKLWSSDRRDPQPGTHRQSSTAGDGNKLPGTSGTPSEQVSSPHRGEVRAAHGPNHARGQMTNCSRGAVQTVDPSTGVVNEYLAETRRGTYTPGNLPP